MDKQRAITQEYLKEILNYDPGTGIFTWKVKTHAQSRIQVGGIAGNASSNEYVRICINKKYYQAHRLAWLFVYGVFPQSELDHINRNKTDNRICNLRIVTTSENQKNTGLRKDNKSGSKGVCWHKGIQRWVANMRKNGKVIFLGSFKEKNEATRAYQKASLEMYPTINGDL